MLLQIKDLNTYYGKSHALQNISLKIDKGEFVCLLGRNGSGKTSLLKVVSGDLHSDGGEIIRQPTIKVAGLPQSVPPGISGSTHSVVSSGLGDLGALIKGVPRNLGIPCQLVGVTDGKEALLCQDER